MTLLFMLLVAIGISVLACFFNNRKKRQRLRRLFRPLTRLDENNGTHDRGGYSHASQLFSSSLTIFGMRAAGRPGANWKAPHPAGLVHSGGVCWTTGMNRVTCACANCSSRRRRRPR